MYAGVPCYNLHELSKAIAADSPTPRTLSGAWKEMRLAWRRQKVDPGYQFDTPVPTAATAVATDDVRADDQLGASIGDLAPESLAQTAG